MSAPQVSLLLLMVCGSLVAAPDFGWALGSLAWSVLGFVAGIGAGWLLWGRKDMR